MSSSPNYTADSTKPKRTPWLILGLPLLVAVAVMLFSPNFKRIEGQRNAPLGADYLQEWIGAKLFLRGEQHQLYDSAHTQRLQHDLEIVEFDWPEEQYFPMVYPPFYYQSLQPLALLSYPLASKVWLLLSALAFSLSGWLLFRFYQPCRRIFAVCFVAALIFVPLLNCLNMGQKSTFVFLILTGTFLLLHHKRPLLAGCVFGLIVFKPHLGIVIGLTMLLKGQWKFAVGALGVVCSIGAFSWVSNPQLCRDYFNVLAGMTDYVQTGGYQLNDSHSFWGAMQLTFSGLPPGMVKGITIGLSLLIVGILTWVVYGRIETDSPNFARQFSAMIFAMVVLSPHFYSYDLSILLLAMLLIASSYAPGKWKANPHDRNLGMILIFIFALGGMFAQIASQTGFQPSVWLLTAAMIFIALSLRDQPSLSE